jgi:hypothetical protein
MGPCVRRVDDRVARYRFEFQTAYRAQTQLRDLAAPAREFLPEKSCPSEHQRAQGMPGARSTRSLAWCVENTRVSHHGHTGSPGIPRAMVLTGSFALSPVTGLVCHRRRRSLLRRLDASVGASGPHDFAVHLKRRSSTAPSASTASRPASVTIASRPSVGRDGEGYRFDLGQARNGKFVQTGLDTP